MALQPFRFPSQKDPRINDSTLRLVLLLHADWLLSPVRFDGACIVSRDIVLELPGIIRMWVPYPFHIVLTVALSRSSATTITLYQKEKKKLDTLVNRWSMRLSTL